MKLAVSCFLVCVGMTVFAADANAVMCARGVYRAGCAGPRGAVVVHRPVAGSAPTSWAGASADAI